MKKFLFTANVHMRADDLDDAFRQLAEHFEKLRAGEDSDLIERGEMNLQPIAFETA